MVSDASGRCSGALRGRNFLLHVMRYVVKVFMVTHQPVTGWNKGSTSLGTANHYGVV